MQKQIRRCRVNSYLWLHGIENGRARSRFGWDGTVGQTAVIPYVSMIGKEPHSVLFLYAAVRMAAECRARILWQMVILDFRKVVL